jgi:D-glycero-alpha-D-manno-heptose-7-phosphate kinase
MVLVSTGTSRDSATHAAITKRNLSSKSGKEYAVDMAQLAKEIGDKINELKDLDKAITELAEGINEGWKYKTQLSGTPSEEVQNLISQGMNHGALGAKLCGAGGSGFVFFLLGDCSRDEFTKNFPENKIQSIEIFSKSKSVADKGISM